MDVAVGVIASVAVAIAVDLLIAHFGRERILIRVVGRIRDRAATDDRIIEALDEDPFVGRDYARPSSRGTATATP
jgi:hypothetical protein